MADPRPNPEPWKAEVLRLIRKLWRSDQVFSLREVYAASGPIARRHPGNQRVEEKIRQVLQQLRNDGEVTFVDYEGHYSPSGYAFQPGDPLAGIQNLARRGQLLHIRGQLGRVVPNWELRRSIPGFRGRKWTYQPAHSAYVLWIREADREIHPFQDITYRPDGSWTCRYAPEGRGGRPDLTLPGNRGLVKCMDDHVPFGVFRRVPDLRGETAYEVLGLAYVQSFDGKDFVLVGEPIDETTRPIVSDIAPTFQPFERDPTQVAEVLRTIRNHRFGVKVRRAYHERCSLCDVGFRVHGGAVGLDAAHIIPVEQRGVLGDVRNGILLCKNHHSLFDHYAWTMDDEFRIRVAPDRTLRESAIDNHILRLEGRRLPNLPTEADHVPATAAIAWRGRQFDAVWA